MQARGHSIASPELHLSEDPPLGEVDQLSPGPSIHPGQEQLSSGLPVSSKPGPGVRCASSELGRVSGVCLSTLVNDTAGSEEAPLIFWGPQDSHCSILAPETVVSGPAGPGGGRSSQSANVSRSPQPTTLSLSSSQDRQAVPSYLETIQQFARSQGFSSRAVKQLGFARRSSSRAVYQSKWLVYRSWWRGKDHSISRPTLPKIADFLLWLYRVRKLSVSAIVGYRSMFSAIFRFKLPEISTSPVLQDLLRSFQVEAPCRSI